MQWSHVETINSYKDLDPAGGLMAFSQLVRRLFIAAVPALAILVAAAWSSTDPQLEAYLHAGLWAAGFVYLALAVDSESRLDSLLLAASGLALPVLALLGSRLAGEFAIVAAAVVAVWVFGILMRRD
jgi:hypothetical protein